jgi:hypothetical protein
MLNIEFNNLGNIKNGNLTLKDFTILCGDNNTGKTYATYAIYALLDKDFYFNFKEIKKIIVDLFENGLYELDIKIFTDDNYNTLKEEIEKGFFKNLYTVFSASEDEFKRTKISFTLDKTIIEDNIAKSKFKAKSYIGKKESLVFEAEKDESSNIIKFILHDNKMSKDFLEDRIKDVLSKTIFKQLFSNSFLLPAERTGLNLFYKELGRERTTLVHHLQKATINTMDLVKDLFISRYPQPIGDYIDFLNDIHNLKKLKSPYKNFAIEIQQEILRGKYKIEKDGIYFVPYKTYANKENFNDKISLHMTSSTVKTFFSLVFYLEHLAQEGYTLIIDEPELNLHPDNQRKIARILSKLVNHGIKIIVSTHSDYFIRELNNLIMLNGKISEKDKLLKKYNYTNDMLLDQDKIEAYLFDKNTITKLKKDTEEGIHVSTFDEVTNKLNESSEDIYFSKMEE